MLPFLQKKKEVASQSGIAIKSIGESEENDSSAIEACAMELIIAVHTKDVKAVADALQSAFEILECDSKISPHTFEAQNIIK